MLLTAISLAFDFGFGGLVFTDSTESFIGSPDPNANGYYNIYLKSVSNITGIKGTLAFLR